MDTKQRSSHSEVLGTRMIISYDKNIYDNHYSRITCSHPVDIILPSTLPLYTCRFVNTSRNPFTFPIHMFVVFLLHILPSCHPSSRLFPYAMPMSPLVVFPLSRCSPSLSPLALSLPLYIFHLRIPFKKIPPSVISFSFSSFRINHTSLINFPSQIYNCRVLISKLYIHNENQHLLSQKILYVLTCLWPGIIIFFIATVTAVSYYKLQNSDYSIPNN